MTDLVRFVRITRGNLPSGAQGWALAEAATGAVLKVFRDRPVALAYASYRRWVVVAHPTKEPRP